MRWAIAGDYCITLSRVLSVDRGLAWLRGTALDLDWWSASGWMNRTKDGWVTWLRARAAEVLHPFHARHHGAGTDYRRDRLRRQAAVSGGASKWPYTQSFGMKIADKLSPLTLTP